MSNKNLNRVMKNMKNSETCHQARKPPVTTQFNGFRVRFIATVCAAIAVCFALTSQASNLLVNPGFDPSFAGWSAHTTEGWSYATHTDQYISPPNDLWMQGLYGNGGAPNSGYVSYVYQSFPTAPGFGYTADAHFSQYVQFFGVTGTPAEGGDNGTANTSLTGGCGLFNNNDTGTYYEDGFVEVVFLDAASLGTIGTAAHILADYKSVIIDPAFEQTILNNTTSVVVTSVNTNFPTVVTNTYLNWIDVPVTNQYDRTTILDNQDPSVNNPYTHTPATPGTITNTLSNGVMVAPPGAAYVQFRLCLYQLSFASGAPHWDDCSLNQVSGQLPDSISAITPSAGVFLTNTTFSFNVNTPSPGVTTPTNYIHVVVNGLDQSSSLQFSGNNTNWNVTLPGLTSNTLYTISITASNTATLPSAASSRFDTFGPGNFVVPAETYDYSGGQFIQNPVPSTNSGPSSYWGLSGIPATDYFIAPGAGVSGGGNSLQPGYPNRGTNTDAAWQIPSDPQLPSYSALGAPTSGVYNVTIAYNNSTDWFKYTRTYPSGNYIIYARMSSGNGAAGGFGGSPGGEYLNLETGGHGTTNATGTNVGIFIPTINNDWGTYYWYPLTDANGNVLVVNLPAGQQTLQLVSKGNCNLSYFMFAPLPPLGLAPAIKNLNLGLATGGNVYVFVSTNELTFTVSSITSTVATNDIHTYLNGTDVTSSETFTGSNTNWLVSVPLSLPANQVNQTFGISVKDANGLTNGASGTFDTFNQTNFMFEAEDFDFNSGQFIDNPIPTGAYVGVAPNGTYPVYAVAAVNSYFLNPAKSGTEAIDGVDLTTLGLGNSTNTYIGEIYRPNADAGTEVATDFLRQKFTHDGTNFNDFDLAWWFPGTWLNYTRTFPTNTYNVYGRLASATPYSGATMSLVTSGWGTLSNQTTRLLGSFSDPNANGFQSWHWVPLLNTDGQKVVVSLGGTNTLKVTAPPGSATGSLNANYYMLVPAASAVHLSISRTGNTISIQFPTQSGFSYTVLYSGSLNPANWQTLTTISGDGSVKTATDTMGSSPRFYRVSAQAQ
jgi:hypothetical protein